MGTRAGFMTLLGNCGVAQCTRSAMAILYMDWVVATSCHDLHMYSTNHPPTHLSMMSASSSSLASRFAAAARPEFTLPPPPEDIEPLPAVVGAWCSIWTATAVECHSAA